jgi:hypothetical protein
LSPFVQVRTQLELALDEQNEREDSLDDVVERDDDQVADALESVSI